VKANDHNTPNDPLCKEFFSLAITGIYGPSQFKYIELLEKFAAKKCADEKKIWHAFCYVRASSYVHVFACGGEKKLLTSSPGGGIVVVRKSRITPQHKNLRVKKISLDNGANL